MRSYKINPFLLFILSSVLFYGCLADNDFEEGQFPLIPVNFKSINSEFDDYNSALDIGLYNQFTYLFSSNRTSAGIEYNIENFVVEFHYESSTNQALFNAYEDGFSYYDSALVKVNSTSNELGPYLMYSRDFLYNFFFYAGDSSGNLDIYYLQHYSYNQNWDEPIPLSKINSANNEAYPTFNRLNSEMYFCSDADGVYDIYKVEISGSSLSRWLQTEDLPTWIACDALNSSFNDKCPYIIGDLMVFTSDRAGGYGGYDLYYSEYLDGSWQEPVNFGESINSEYDEYRPVIVYANFYTTDLMFFSSNRPGGLGGFDLYYVGIPKMIF